MTVPLLRGCSGCPQFSNSRSYDSCVSGHLPEKCEQNDKILIRDTRDAAVAWLLRLPFSLIPGAFASSSYAAHGLFSGRLVKHPMSISALLVVGDSTELCRLSSRLQQSTRSIPVCVHPRLAGSL